MQYIYVYIYIYTHTHTLYHIDTSHLLTKIPFNKLRNTFILHNIECSKSMSVNGTL